MVKVNLPVKVLVQAFSTLEREPSYTVGNSMQICRCSVVMKGKANSIRASLE